MAQVKQDKTLAERAAEEVMDEALSVYNAHTQGRVLRRPDPRVVSKSMINAIVPKIVEMVESAVETEQPQPQADESAPVNERELQARTDEAYRAGVHHAWTIVENLEGRPGKKMIAELLRQELRKIDGAAEE